MLELPDMCLDFNALDVSHIVYIRLSGTTSAQRSHYAIMPRLNNLNEVIPEKALVAL